MSKNSSVASIIKQYAQQSPSLPSQQRNRASQRSISHLESVRFIGENDSSNDEDDDNDSVQNMEQIESNPISDVNYEYGDVEYWTNAPFPWSGQALVFLKRYFHIQTFRPLQQAAINATLSNRDVFICLPTAAGKSLIFQLPALLKKGITIVFMPLIALIEDQINQLKEKGIPILNLSGEKGKFEGKWFPTILKQCRESMHEPVQNYTYPYPKMIFMSPEKLTANDAVVKFLKDLYNLRMIERFVIDEAHCVFMWGHEFRKDYLDLKRLKADFPGVPLLAMTATATEDYRSEIINQLGMVDTIYFQNSFNRENLFFEVRVKQKNYEIEQMAEFINEFYRDKTGIIYVTCRNDAERISQALQVRFYMKCDFYHAGVDEKRRKDIQKAWMAGSIHIIVATIAFGMGINKPDVRFVLHYNLSKSMTQYYQEAGRAGRDGKQAHCVLFYHPKDQKTLDYFITSNNATKEVKRENVVELLKMVKYCENIHTCRRVMLLHYFNEPFDKNQCNKSCDNCKGNKTGVPVDVTETAKKIVQFVQAKADGYKLRELPRRLLGIGKRYGTGVLDKSIMDKNEVLQIIHGLIIEKSLCQDYKTIKSKRGERHESQVCGGQTDHIQALFQGKTKIHINHPIYSFRTISRQRFGRSQRKKRQESQIIDNRFHTIHHYQYNPTYPQFNNLNRGVIIGGEDHQTSTFISNENQNGQNAEFHPSLHKYNNIYQSDSHSLENPDPNNQYQEEEKVDESRSEIINQTDLLSLISNLHKVKEISQNDQFSQKIEIPKEDENPQQDENKPITSNINPLSQPDFTFVRSPPKENPSNSLRDFTGGSIGRVSLKRKSNKQNNVDISILNLKKLKFNI